MKKTIFTLSITLITFFAFIPIRAYAELPTVDIYANKANIASFDPVKITVKVDNKSDQNLDMYAAVLYHGALYFYPTWDLNPTAEAHRTTVLAGAVLEKTILDVPFFIKASGSFTFYSAIVEGGTTNVISLDAVSIEISGGAVPTS